MTQTVRQIPSIQQQPRQASDTAIHYGYVAYKDISLRDSLGITIHCQPDTSPYYKFLPCRELLPFTNITFGTQDELGAATNTHNKNPMGAVKVDSKTARVCAEDVATAYQEWAFVVLDHLTGYTEEDAFAVFQAIQPFYYRLKDLTGALDQAPARISATAPYTVNYGDVELELQPLRAELKDVALKTLETIRVSAERALMLAQEKRDKTTIAMTAAFAGQGGKLTADPHDRYVSEEIGWTIPQLLQDEAKPVTPMYSESPESIDLKRKEIELREREIALREQEMEMRTAEANRAKMAQVRAAKKNDADNS